MTLENYSDTLEKTPYNKALYRPIFTDKDCKEGEPEIIKPEPDENIFRGFPIDSLKKINHRKEDFFKIIDFLK